MPIIPSKVFMRCTILSNSKILAASENYYPQHKVGLDLGQIYVNEPGNNLKHYFIPGGLRS